MMTAMVPSRMRQARGEDTSDAAFPGADGEVARGNKLRDNHK